MAFVTKTTRSNSDSCQTTNAKQMLDDSKNLETSSVNNTIQVFFVLIPHYSSLSLFSALDTLRLANRCLRKRHFEWHILSDCGEPVESSLGTRLAVDDGLRTIDRNSLIFVCSGEFVQSHCSPKLLSWIRRQRRVGTRIGGLCKGAYVLAKAGLLSNRAATIHWENGQSFREDFPDVELSDQVFVAEEGIYTTAGGTASIDVMLRIIDDSLGKTLSQQVAGQLNYNDIKYNDIKVLQDRARIGTPQQIGVRNQRLTKSLELMEASLEDPLSLSYIADQIGISVRQLERLFRAHLGRSPKRFYNGLRLQRGQQLLLQTDISITEISIACGFQSNSHFSKLFKKQFGLSPYSLRNTVG